MKDKIKVEYAYQDINNLPEGYSVPEGRTKPWGTGHAVLSCDGIVDGPFAVINAADYYGKEFYDRKGISNIYFANQVLTDFDVYTIPLDNLDCLKFGELKAENKNGPVFLKGTFKAGKGECFVDMNGFTKGYVFVNGFNLGRYWDIGPQKALYLPGALLKEENEIIVFEIEKYKTPEIVIGDTPMLGRRV